MVHYKAMLKPIHFMPYNFEMNMRWLQNSTVEMNFFLIYFLIHKVSFWLNYLDLKAGQTFVLITRRVAFNFVLVWYELNMLKTLLLLFRSSIELFFITVYLAMLIELFWRNMISLLSFPLHNIEFFFKFLNAFCYFQSDSSHKAFLRIHVSKIFVRWCPYILGFLAFFIL